MQHVQSLINTDHLMGSVTIKGIHRKRIFQKVENLWRPGRTVGTGVDGWTGLSEGLRWVDHQVGCHRGTDFLPVSSLSSEHRPLHQTHLSLQRWALCEQGQP